jgi:hypothetical protein
MCKRLVFAKMGVLITKVGAKEDENAQSFDIRM